MKIGIIGAMSEEVDVYLNQLDSVVTTEVGPFIFQSGSYGDHDVTLIESGIGKVNAATATALLINNFASELVINTGSAGGLGGNISIGDVVVANELRYHDVDVCAFDYEFGQVPRMPAAYHIDENLLSQIAALNVDIKRHAGLITSSDSFIASEVGVSEIKNKFPEVLAIDMESTAIAQVCFHFDVMCLIIRSITDHASQDADQHNDEFLEQASKNAAEVALALMHELA